MAKQVIQLGTAPTGVGGDTPRSANIKINSNFDELYAADAVNYKKGNIVGPVSQSGGVPTGAIIESGNGVNGRYTRWADGTQHCWITMNYYTAIDAPQMGVYVSGWIAWSFQAPFIARPNVLITARDDTFLFGSSVSGTTAGEVVRFASATPLAAGAKLATLFAVGRWF